MADIAGELIGECQREDCAHRFAVGGAAAALAASELEEGDLLHAAHHLAAAIALDPLRSEWRALLDRLLQAAPDPLALWPVHPEPTFVGNLVCHAHAVATRNAEPGRGLLLLVKAAKQQPGPAYLALAAEWFEAPGALKRPKPSEVAQALELWLKPWLFVRAPRLSATERRDLERFRPALEQLLKTHATSGPLQGLGSCYLRIIGRTAMAVTVAQRAYQGAMRFLPAVTLGLAQHAKGDLAGAIKTYKRAIELDPRATGVEAELGELHFELGQFGGALAWYRKAIEKGLASSIVEPAILAARYKKDGDPTCLDELRRLATEDPPDARARQWLARVGHPLPAPAPFVDFLPASAEVSLQLLWKLLLRSNGVMEGLMVGAALNALEAPSARLAYDQLCDLLKVQSTLRIAAVQTPDPRVPVCDVEHLLWSYDGTLARPAVEAPPAESIVDVIAIAETAFALPAWTEAARAAGERLGPAAIPALLAVMVHPPRCPLGPEVTPDRWLLRIQHAAALIIAHTETGWPGSRRRAALHALIHGPMDWTVQAALVAVGQAATSSPEASEEARRWVQGLLGRVPKPGHCCWLLAALAVAQRLPGAPDEERQRYATQAAAIVADQAA
jgi:tetratricopeptide (TPR) repeat protein